MTQLYQAVGVFAVGVPPLGLDIGRHGSAHVGTLVVIQAALGHGAVDHVHRAIHQAALVRVLDAEDEGAVLRAGDEPGIKGRAQVAHVHIAGGGGGETGAHLAVGDLGLHFGEIGRIDGHGNTSCCQCKNFPYIIWNLREKVNQRPTISCNRGGDVVK